MKLVLAAILSVLCYRSVLSQDSKCLPPDNITVGVIQQVGPINKTTENGFVSLIYYPQKLLSSGVSEEIVLQCVGYTNPHGKLVWYRYYNESPGCIKPVRIDDYWSFLYHYEVTSLHREETGQVESKLIIDRFSEGYAGLYFCILSISDNPALNVKSPLTNLTYISDPRPSEPLTAYADVVRSDYPIQLNISAELVENAILISWEKRQRNEERDYCLHKYTWTLEVFTWTYNEIVDLYSLVWNQSFVQNDSQTPINHSISPEDCDRNNTYFSLSESKNFTYYKFQIKVYNTKKGKLVKGSDFYGSHLYYFDKQVPPYITYPREGQILHDNEKINCKADGEPKPNIIVQHINHTDFSAFTCIAQTLIVTDPPMERCETLQQQIVNYLVYKTPNTNETPTPIKPSVPYESEKVICDGYIANSSLVYIATHNVTKLEDQASEIFRKLNNFTDNDCLQLMKAFVCNSLFLSFHYIMDSTPVHICQQSCDAIFECGDEMFKLIQNQLSVSTNFSSCISPTETEDRNSSKCIDLLPPSNESKSSALFQIRLFPIGNCNHWIEMEKYSKLDEIKSKIFEFIMVNFSSTFSVVKESFSCRGSIRELANTVVFRAMIYSEVNADSIVNIIDQWIKSETSLTVGCITLNLDHRCPAMLNSFDETDCTNATTNADVISQSKNNDILLIAITAVVVIEALLILIAVVVICYKKTTCCKYMNTQSQWGKKEQEHHYEYISRVPPVNHSSSDQREDMVAANQVEVSENERSLVKLQDVLSIASFSISTECNPEILSKVTQEQKHHYDYILDIPIDIISGCSSEQEQVKMDDTLACQTDMLPKEESQVTLDSESEVTAAQSEEIDPAYCEPAHIRRHHNSDSSFDQRLCDTDEKSSFQAANENSQQESDSEHEVTNGQTTLAEEIDPAYCKTPFMYI